MTDLCREFGISRKTGYKIWERFKAEGASGLFDESRRPHRTPHKTAEEVVAAIVGVKKQYPSWGAKKIRHRLGELQPGVKLPATSTVHDILKRKGLVNPRSRRRRVNTAYTTGVGQSNAANQIWTADFKGQFRLGSRRYCYPLTISDHFSRYFLACEGLESTRTAPTKAVFEAAFRDYGLPRMIRTDNGVPFASQSLGGLSQLSVWWLKLGIVPERIEPGHPEQNGRHERLHLTLKRETTRPAGKNMLQQQERFDAFVAEYNHERPHESLDMKRPADLYERSNRNYNGTTPEPSYPLHDLVRCVSRSGGVYLGRGKRFQLGRALAGELVGMRELEEARWLVSFSHIDLGHFDEADNRFLAIQPIRMAPPTKPTSP